MSNQPVELGVKEYKAARQSGLSGRELYDAALRGDFKPERIDRDREKLDNLAKLDAALRGDFKPERIDRDREKLDFKPERIDRDWEKLDNLAKLDAAQRPDWMTEDVAGVVSAARDYMSNTGAALPGEVRSMLGSYLDRLELPTAAPKTTAAGMSAMRQANQAGGAQPTAPAAPTQAQPVGMGGYTQAQMDAFQPAVTDAETYGMTPEEWDSLDAWQKISMRMFGSNKAAAASTGALAGLEGGIPGMVAGAAAGTLLGSAAERFPVLTKVFDALDVAGRGYKRLVGLGELGSLALEDALGKDTGVSYADLLKNLDDAWRTGDQAYRVMNAGDWLELAQRATDVFNPAGRGLKQGLEALDQAGIIDMPDLGALAEKAQLPMLRSGEAWQFGSTEAAQLTQEQAGAQALGEYFNRLKDAPAGEWEATKAALDAEFAERYGFQGDMRDLVGSVFLDPLNVAGTGATSAVRGIAKGLGANALSDAMKGADGPVQGLKRFKATSALKSFDDYQSMTGFERMLSGAWTKEGTPSLLSVPEPTTNKLKNAWRYTTSLTPEARAREYTSVASQNLAALAEMSQANPEQFVKLVEVVAGNDMVAARNIGAEFFGGAEMTSVVPMLRENLGALKQAVGDWYNPANVEMRALLQDAAQRTGRSLDEVVASLTDATKADINARTMAANLGGDLTPDALKQAAETIGRQPLTETALSAKLYSDLVDGAAKFSADYFKVRPDHWTIRLSNLVKSAQGMLLLDLSPTYLANNVVDNTMKLAREGVMGYLTPEKSVKFMNEFFGEGVVPTRLQAKGGGLVGTDLAEAQGGRQDVIALSTKARGKIAGAQEAIGKARSVTGVASKVSGSAEAAQRRSAMIIGMKKAWGNLWQPGRGFDRLPDNLARALGPDLTRRIESRIAGQMSGDIRASLLTDAAYTLDDAIGESAAGMGKTPAQVRQLLDGLGISDTLKEKLASAATDDQKRAAFGEVHTEIQKKLDEWHTSQLLAQAEKAANVAGAEGPLGVMRVFDEINQAYYEQRMTDFDQWESIFERRASMKPEEFGALVQRQFTEDQKTYRRMNSNARAQYGGVAQKLGLENQYGRQLAQTLADTDDAWAGFYDYRKQQLKEFFKGKGAKNLTPEQQRVRWQETQARIQAEYERTHTRVQELTGQRDAALVDMLGERYGDSARQAAEAWLTGVRTLEGEMYQGMTDFRKRTADMSAVEKRAEWTKFLNEEHRPKLAKRLADNLEGSRNVYVAADDARRAATRPPVPHEITPAQVWVDEARRQKLYQMTGLDDAQRAAVMRNRQLAAEYGIASADEAGKPVSGFDKRLLATVKKYTGEEYPNVYDVPEDVLRRALDERAKINSPQNVALPAQDSGYTPGMNDGTPARIDTPEFSRWFGDSKIVDDNGQPLVVHHGTNAQSIESFGAGKLGEMTFDNGADWLSFTSLMGFWFHDTPLTGAGGIYKNDMPVYLSIKNPLQNVTLDDLAEFIRDNVSESSGEVMRRDFTLSDLKDYDIDIRQEVAAMIRKLQDDGYDGIVVNDEEFGGMSYVAFDPRQIKSVNNSGAFDPNSTSLFDGRVAPESPAPAPVAQMPEPTPAEVNALALDLEQQRIDGALKGWTDSVPGKRTTEPTPQPVDPDPVGYAPPGTVDSLEPMPNLSQMFEEGWATEAGPLLRDIEGRMFAPRDQTLPGATLDPAQRKELAGYLARVQGQRAEAKLAATKYAEISVDMAMLNYDRRYGVDNFLQMAAPYQFWFGRTAINWALTAIDRPAWMANYHRLREMQEKLATPIEGFPSRLNGKMQIEMPFMPQEWGKTIYVDPWHNVFGFEGMAAQVMRPLLRDFSNKRSRAEYIIQERLANEEISEAEAVNALRTRSGALWDQAMQQANGEVEAEIASPVDLAATMFAPSIPVKWALESLGVMQGSRLQGNALAQMSTMPSPAFIQNVTSFVTPGGVNLGEKLQQWLGAAEAPTDSQNRGYLWDYYVSRELANMAADGADVEAVKLAMIDKTGPLYQQAVDRVGKQQAVRSFASMLWADLFPEGEQEQRALKMQFEKAADAGKLGEFLDAHPEYEARMQMSGWDDPEKMMRSFLRSSVWERWNELSSLEKRAVKDQLGDLFTENFVNKETRNYDSITTETLAQWARQLKGTVPETAPETAQAPALELPAPEMSAAYDQYKQLYDHPGYQMQRLMYSLPEGMRDQFAAAHPEISQYQDAKAIFLAAHPELIGEVIGEDNRLAGATPEVQAEVYQYWAERAQRFPGIGATQDAYYALDKAQRKAFLKQHPELGEYWDWNKEAVNALSGDAYYYAKGPEAVKKLAQGKDYQAPYQPDVSTFPPDLTLAIVAHTLAKDALSSGATVALRAEYRRQRPPISYEEWLDKVLAQFTTF